MTDWLCENQLSVKFDLLGVNYWQNYNENCMELYYLGRGSHPAFDDPQIYPRMLTSAKLIPAPEYTKQKHLIIA